MKHSSSTLRPAKKNVSKSNPLAHGARQDQKVTFCILSSTLQARALKPFSIGCRISGERNRIGRCYQLSFQGILKAKEWVLVHGEVEGYPGTGRVGHAWLEFDGMVYDPTDDTLYDTLEYRIGARAKPIAIYTHEQACAMGVKFLHYGPWC